MLIRSDALDPHVILDHRQVWGRWKWGIWLLDTPMNEAKAKFQFTYRHGRMKTEATFYCPKEQNKTKYIYLKCEIRFYLLKEGKYSFLSVGQAPNIPSAFPQGDRKPKEIILRSSLYFTGCPDLLGWQNIKASVLDSHFHHWVWKRKKYRCYS